MDRTKLDPQLKRHLEANPDVRLRLIVRVAGDLGTRAEALAGWGLVVHRQLPLIGALAIEATGTQALALSREPWLIRLEEDREMRALGSGDSH